MKKEKKARPDLLSMSLTIFGYSLALGFVSLMFAPIMMSEILIIRLFFDGALIVIAGVLYFASGAYKGEKDCATGDMLEKRARESGQALTGAERQRVFRASKGPLSALLGSAPWVILGIIVAVLSVPYTYSLQGLPGWLSGYRALPEVGNALLYYDQQIIIPLASKLEPIVRFVLLPFVFPFGEMGDAAALWVNRLSPLIALLLPACYALGYLSGPRRHKRTLQYIADIKAKPRKRRKKNVKPKGPGNQEKNQLI